MHNAGHSLSEMMHFRLTLSRQRSHPSKFQIQDSVGLFRIICCQLERILCAFLWEQTSRIEPRLKTNHTKPRNAHFLQRKAASFTTATRSLPRDEPGAVPQPWCCSGSAAPFLLEAWRPRSADTGGRVEGGVTEPRHQPPPALRLAQSARTL